MGQYDVRINERADRQISAALRWWSRNRLLAPDLLRSEIAHAIALIRAHPRIAPPTSGHDRRARRMVLPRTGYLLYYSLCRDGALEVRRLIHGARTHR